MVVWVCRLASRPLLAAVVWTGIGLAVFLGLVWLAEGFIAGAEWQEMTEAAERQRLTLLSQTRDGPEMSAVTVSGLVDPVFREALRGERALTDALLLEHLDLLREEVGAIDVLLVNSEGAVILARRQGEGTTTASLTGLAADPGFPLRPALNGTLVTFMAVPARAEHLVEEDGDEPRLYLAAPVRAEPHVTSAAVGALVARLPVRRLEEHLKEWPGPALLLSPQGVVYVTSRPEWEYKFAGPVHDDRLGQVLATGRLGELFDDGNAESLPFDEMAADETATDVVVDGRPHALMRRSLPWHDPAGDWQLFLLQDQSEWAPDMLRYALAAAASLLAIVGTVACIGWGRVCLLSRQAEAAIRGQNLALEVAGIAALLLRPDGSIGFVTRPWAAMGGWDASRLPGRPFRTILAEPFSSPSLTAMRAEAGNTVSSLRTTLILRTSSGQRCPVPVEGHLSGSEGDLLFLAADPMPDGRE